MNVLSFLTPIRQLWFSLHSCNPKYPSYLQAHNRMTRFSSLTVYRENCCHRGSFLLLRPDEGEDLGCVGMSATIGVPIQSCCRFYMIPAERIFEAIGVMINSFSCPKLPWLVERSDRVWLLLYYSARYDAVG